MQSNPFFSIMLMYLRYVAVYSMDRISTDGTAIYFSPDFLDKLYGYEMDYVLCHQILHIILGHCFAPLETVDDNIHLAFDIKVNGLLYMLGFQRERYPHLGDIQRKYRGSEQRASEAKVKDIYENLSFSLYVIEEKSRRKFFCDSYEYWSFNKHSHRQQVMIIDLPDIFGKGSLNTEADGFSEDEQGNVLLVPGDNNPCNDNSEIIRKWKQRAFGAMNLQAGTGKAFAVLSQCFKRELLETSDASLNWRKILNNFIQENVADYSFSPPDRRFSELEFFLPDFNENESDIKDVLFMVDTSGSVDISTLTDVYSEIKGAVRQFNGKLQGWLGFFDTDVYDPLPFENIDDITRITPIGGGGTDFRTVFEYIKEQQAEMNLQGIVIFTDGFGPFPDKEDVENLQVLWVLDNDYVTPEFGLVVRILPFEKQYS